MNCTMPVLSPAYGLSTVVVALGRVLTLSPHLDLSVLPSDASRWLSAPMATTPAFIGVSLGFSTIFFVLFSLIAFRSKLGKLGPTLDKPMVQRSCAWIGIFGFMIGTLSKYSFGRPEADTNSHRSHLVFGYSSVVRKSR